MEMIFDEEPVIRVGILTSKALSLTFEGEPENDFIIHDVVIGKNFHWERKEDQKFKGEFEILKNQDGTLSAINKIKVEDYLQSVISSEMSASSGIELLKAHAVISRSWVLSQIFRDKRYKGIINETADDWCESIGKTIKWYDKEDHDKFDVCADDHCQRYQGISRQVLPNVNVAVLQTRGEILTYDGKICDARFSKCCGGITEEFETCWEPYNHQYLKIIKDSSHGDNQIPDMTLNSEAELWIKNSPDTFCNVQDSTILNQILNNYDLEDSSFYRWTVKYSQEELDILIAKRSGIDFGKILEITPLKRGRSGRIILLRIKGSKFTSIVGKELEIRKWLSYSHLKSSAFLVERDENGNWIFRGAGWGHGVGLCQIGAAVMASKGYNYRQILEHYFPGAKIIKGYL